MTDTMTGDIDPLDFFPSLEFWGGPLDGTILDKPEDRALPNRSLALFPCPFGVVHDPDGPGRTVYFWCPGHGRLEVMKPELEHQAMSLDPDDD